MHIAKFQSKRRKTGGGGNDLPLLKDVLSFYFNLFAMFIRESIALICSLSISYNLSIKELVLNKAAFSFLS